MKSFFLQVMVILLCLISGQSQAPANRSTSTKPVTSRANQRLNCVPAVADFSSQIGSQAHPNSPDPVKSATAGDTYAQDRPCFAGYLQVEATNTFGLNVVMLGAWGDDLANPRSTSKSDCENTKIEAVFWGFDKKWENLGSMSGPGVWKLENGTYSCSMPVVKKLIMSSLYSKLLVMTKATFGANSRKATASLDNLGW